MEFLEQAKNILGFVAPLVTFFFAIIVSWGIFKWYKRTGDAVKGMTESPGSFIFMIVVIVLFMFMYFKYIAPMF